MLPDRHHTMTTQIRQEDGTYVQQQMNEFATVDALPEWLDDLRERAITDYEDQRDSLDEGEFFTWPDSLQDWTLEDVDYWWESEEYGIRAVGVSTKNLIVEDLKQVDGVPAYQATQSWTRGVQFVMAGGLMVVSGDTSLTAHFGS